MIKTPAKVGNSSALLLDKPILELPGLEEGGEAQLTVESGTLSLSPCAGQFPSSNKVDLLGSVGRVRPGHETDLLGTISP